ncbi:MAG: hypothetical protein K0R12_208 [Gammaproteobacteria bacterium]|jgi:prepilin-type N-terminal cleavage/methylation domain-containing protein|nr:hypothetical protein [Gammaproteobacteria bacterium]
MRNAFTLIEVLIALLLLSIGLLGLLSASSAALRTTQNAFYTAIAAQQLQNLQSELRISHPAFYAPLISQWNKENSAFLPLGKGTLKRNSDSMHLELQWENPEKIYRRSLQMSER